MFKRTCELCFLDDAVELAKLTQENQLTSLAAECYHLRKVCKKDVDALKMIKSSVINPKAYRFLDGIADWYFIFYSEPKMDIAII